MSSMSEDALFKAILKNKPSQSAQKAEVLKNKPQQPEAKESVPKAEVNASQVLDYEKESPVTETVTPPVKPLQAEAVEESIKNLTASVNLMQGLMKTAIVVLVLILVVGVAVFIKS